MRWKSWFRWYLLGALFLLWLGAQGFSGPAGLGKKVDGEAPKSPPPYFDFKREQFLIKGSHSILPAPPIKVGKVRQFLMDNYVVDSTWNCFRTVHQPDKHPGNPVLRPEKSWEQQGIGHAGILYDEDKKRFRLWAWCHDDRPETPADLRNRGIYYESEDGIRWTRPELGIVAFEGSKANNLFLGGGGIQREPFSVFKLPPRLHAKGKFGLFYSTGKAGKQPEVGHTMEQRIAFSDDGIHFKDQRENPVIKGRSDADNNVVYNPERDVFMQYRRPSVNAHEIRRIAYCESKDLVSWTQPLVVLDPDELDPPMLYGLMVTRYQGVYLGTLEMYYDAVGLFNGGRRALNLPQKQAFFKDGRVEKEFHVDIQLAWSRDGILWQRHPARPIFLPNGTFGSHDWGQVYVHQGIIEKGDKLYLYYNGNKHLHLPGPSTSTFNLATLRKDGFVSLDTPGTGYMLTRPLSCPGGRLQINAKTKPGGFIRVAVRNGDGVKDGEWLDGWRFDCAAPRYYKEGATAQRGEGEGPVFTGDSTAAVLEWKGKANFDSLKGRSIRLHLWMQNAELYSFFFD